MDRHHIVQASLAYGFVQVASIIYNICPLNQRGRLTILPSAFGVMGLWYGSKTGLYVANVDGYTNIHEEGDERDEGHVPSRLPTREKAILVHVLQF